MKNLLKILLAVVALAAYSCTTDTTEDLGVQFGGGAGQQTITLSLEASRTQLGEEVNGLYPLHWSAGDKISVNGVESGEAAIDSANPANASFTVSSATAPYCIAYPAAAEGQVVFAAEQIHANNTTFGNGVAAMYGYSATGAGVELHHLTGVLKIGITGDKVLSLAQISTVDRAPIAGAFDIDFATGELTATKSSKDVISYAIPASEADGVYGLELSSTPQYIHIAVPAGEYDELYVTLYDTEGGVMYATVKADDEKPLAAGKVRKFSNTIVYTPNASVFVIKDVASLKEFAAQAATLEKDVLFVADVDMTGEAWTPIEGYAGTIIGNGYAIKGMTAPLFGTTSASVKGLHLEDVALVTNDAIQYGALACKVTATDNVTPTIEHCSVSGTFTVKNTILNPTKEIEPMYGCLIGVSSGAMLDACENRATMTVEQVTASGNTIAFSFFCGDIIGALDRYVKSDESVLYSGITNSKNYGALEYKDISNPEMHRLDIYLGGIAGVSRAANTQALLHNNENHGDITITSNFAISYIGGVAGYAKGVADFDGGSDCENHGKITIKGGSYLGGRMYLGGVWGGPVDFTANRCHNYGAITFEEGEILGSTLTVGGICGKNTGGNTTTVNECTNNAPILIAASCVKDTAISFQIGSIAGYSQSALHNNINNKEGSITISGLFYTNGSRSTQASPKVGTHALGGICGYKTVATMNNNENHADIIWSGDVVELGTGDPGQIRIGGYQGYGSMDVNGAVCDGKIILSGTYGCEINTGGVLTFNYGNPGTITSNTDFEISGTFNGGLIVGGVISVAYGAIQNLTYNGTINITKDAVIKRLFTVGGCIGHAWGVNTEAQTCKVLVNNGTINVAGTIENAVPRIAGCVAAANATSPGVAHNVSNVTNNGPITVSSTVSGGNLYIGGCASYISNYFTGGVNNATLTFSGNHTSNNFYFAGVATDVGEDAKEAVNYGDIICTADCYANSPRVTGAVGYVSDRVTSCINHGNLTYAGECAALSMAGICYYGTANSCTNGAEGDDTKGQIIFTGTATGKTYFSGIMLTSWNANASGSTNYGDMHISGKSGDTMYIGCCIYNGIAQKYSCTDFNNYGDVNVSSIIGNDTKTGSDLFIAGLAYACAKDDGHPKSYINCHNYGNFTVTSDCVVANAIRIGGLIANIEVDIPLTFDSCSNHGNITVEGTSSAHTSGSFMIGGCISNFDDNKQMVIKGGMKNTGNITLAGENKKASVITGGVFGTIAGDAYTSAFELYLANEGNISVSSKAATAIHVGGVVGNLNYAMAIPMYNTGDITVTGEAGTPADNRIGGLASSTAKAFHGECFCNIKAVGYKGYAGMLTGSVRADAFAEANSKVGGSICVEQIEVEDASGNIEPKDYVITLGDSSNLSEKIETGWVDYWYNHLYGVNPDWSQVTTNYDGSTLLTSKAQIVYPTPEVEATPEETPAE